MAVYPTEAAMVIATGIKEASGKVTKRLKKLLGEAAFAVLIGEMRDVRYALK